MNTISLSPTHREELCMRIRCRALDAAARTTVDMDPEVTLRTADIFVEWILKGTKI